MCSNTWTLKKVCNLKISTTRNFIITWLSFCFTYVFIITLLIITSTIVANVFLLSIPLTILSPQKYALILHFQPIIIMFSAMSPHFFYMTRKVEPFLLVVSVKLIYTDNVCPLNSNICKHTWMCILLLSLVIECGFHSLVSLVPDCLFGWLIVHNSFMNTFDALGDDFVISTQTIWAN
jgi:hypothetical protein